ncbi:hypothetical protein [Nitratifractor salsuginis]|uniref:Cobalt transport protein n=1 Tax=Nitratifractor salsuginis (strain DSM 16511 / JCM 12458 / E9I37-1) TaxID=749222 RepID=E6WYA8_NITSE|nr:hypothetical protein [Nitratifractor salsuginis]ADV45356.1 hypothetical protein Nitsa_0083 [Nitratifractor salsuginis DSM 16511]
MWRDRLFFPAAVLGLLILNDAGVLAALIALLWIVSHNSFFRINRRVLAGIFWFNGVTSAGYALVASLKGVPFAGYLLLFNLKVYAISYFVLWFFSRVDLVKFFAFSRDLSYLLTITLFHMTTYKKSFEDFRMAYRARVVRKLRRQEEGFILRVFDFFLSKAMRDAKERTLAMKARGFFDTV